MQNLSHIRITIFESILFVIISFFILVSCDSSIKAPKKYENQIITHKVGKPQKPYPENIEQLRAKTEARLPKELKLNVISAKKAFDVYQKYPGAKQVVKSLNADVKAVLSSSSALEALKPAMWWGVELHGGGGVYPDATVAAYSGDFWNVDVVFNCTNHFEEPSMTQLPERVCFSAANNSNDLYFGLESPSFTTGGPNGIIQFAFTSGTDDTFLGVFTMYGDSENIELYVDETLVSTYNVTWDNREYSFFVDLPAGTHYITAVYTSTASDRPNSQLFYEQFLLYRI